MSVGCMPKLYAPRIATNDRYYNAEGLLGDSLQLDQQWWRQFGDTTLSELVELALAQNRDLWVAASRIRQSEERLGVARASFLPQVGLEAQAEGSYNRQTKIEQQYSLTPTLSWEISLFGAMRHATRAARAAIESAVWNYRAMELAVAAQVATTYFTLRQYERDLYIAIRTTRLRRESAALIDSLFRYGMASGVDADQAYSLVYSSEADIPRYQNAIDQSRLALMVLLGEAPYAYPLLGTGEELISDRHPTAVSAGVPSELLTRRPDILQAYFTLSQAASEVGVERANRFPSITLSASGGIGASSIKGLTSSNPAIWQATGGIVQPIFSFGKLKRNERIAIENYNQAAYNYEQTVLTAFSEVEKALSAIESTRQETDRYRALIKSYEDIVEKAYALYRNGMADYLDVIDAERTLYSARMQLINLVTTQYINYVTLCKALGGGWQG